MRGGFKRQVVPASRVSEVDLASTRAKRQRLHQEIRLRQHVAWLMEHAGLGGELVRVIPFELHSAETSECLDQDEAG